MCFGYTVYDIRGGYTFVREKVSNFNSRRSVGAERDMPGSAAIKEMVEE